MQDTRRREAVLSSRGEADVHNSQSISWQDALRAPAKPCLIATCMLRSLEGLRWCQVGFQLVAAIALGCFSLRVRIDRQRDSALREGQLDPVREAEGSGAGHEFLHSPQGYRSAPP